MKIWNKHIFGFIWGTFLSFIYSMVGIFAIIYSWHLLHILCTLFVITLDFMGGLNKYCQRKISKWWIESTLDTLPFDFIISSFYTYIHTSSKYHHPFPDFRQSRFIINANFLFFINRNLFSFLPELHNQTDKIDWVFFFFFDYEVSGKKKSWICKYKQIKNWINKFLIRKN